MIHATSVSIGNCTRRSRDEYDFPASRAIKVVESRDRLERLTDAAAVC
jgi:hypothetical protein